MMYGGYYLNGIYPEFRLGDYISNKSVDQPVEYCLKDVVETKELFDIYNKFKVSKIIFNDPATIVFWEDGTKTVVKRGIYDKWDPEKAIALCFMKKALGNTGKYNEVIKKWYPYDKEVKVEKRKPKKDNNKNSNTNSTNNNTGSHNRKGGTSSRA